MITKKNMPKCFNVKNIYLAILAVGDYPLNPAEVSSDWLVQEDFPEFLCVLRLYHSLASQGCQLPVEGVQKRT